MNKVKVLQILSILIILGGLVYLNWRFNKKPGILDFGQVSKNLKDISALLPNTNEAPKPKIPDSAQITGVPFVPQAPFANWDQLHEEACEETAVILVDHYLKGIPANKQIVENEIQAQVAWQIQKWGKQHDLTIAEAADYLVKEYLGYQNIKYQYDISLDNIKREVANGDPVIVPMAGRLLANPYYTPPGPLYHYVIVTGYTPTEIIVHDIGVWQGENWHYKADHFWNSLHDWNGGNVNNGRKAMLVINN